MTLNAVLSAKVQAGTHHTRCKGKKEGAAEEMGLKMRMLCNHESVKMSKIEYALLCNK